MITCSKCGELLEDGSEVCYLCKHRLTASERVKADRIAEDYKPVLAAILAETVGVAKKDVQHDL